jgi:hypothetical protein
LDEAQIFLPAESNETVFQAVVEHYWGTWPPAKAAIEYKFPVSKYNGSQTARMKAFYQFSTFTCNSRFISEGFKTYNIQYGRTPGTHGSDVTADFYLPSNVSNPADPTFGTFATSFQSYLTSHARTGDPNTLRDAGTIQWPFVTLGPVFSNVLDASDSGFSLFSDIENEAVDCDFWRDLAAGMTFGLGKLRILPRNELNTVC